MFTQKKQVLSFLLAMVLVLMTVLPVTASAATSHEDFMRVFHLDVGRKYFTVDQVKEIIDSLSASSYTHIELAVGNGGLRFLLDDMSVTVGNTTYSSDKVTAGVKAGNVSFAHSGEWSQSEMDSVISYAASKNIGIIPLVNTPGHMNTILDAAEYVGISSPAYSTKISSWWDSTSTKTSASTVSLSNANAVAFTQALVKKYVDYFAARGSEYFNIGADEYAADVHSSGSMGFGYMQSNGWYDDYVNYINQVAAIIKNAGMKPIAFNDGIYFNHNDDTAFDQDIIIAYWIPAWGTYYVASPAYLVSKGHKILNTNDDWYYVIGRTSEVYGYDNAYNGVNNTPVTKVADGSTMSLSNLAGSMNCVWCDEPNASYESNKANVMYFIETLAAKNPDYFVVNSHEHTFETVTVDATCTEKGSITTTCTGCGESTVEVIEATGHNYECVVTEATCGKDGSKVYTCTACADTYTETIPATGEHTYNCVTVDATCVDKGTNTYTCTVCGDSYAETIPATGIHLYKSETVNPTCIEDGAVVYTCPVCGDSYSDPIATTGHNYTCVITEATCTEDGVKVFTCSVCDDTYSEAIPAVGHSYTGVVTGATCTEGGFTTYTCEGCGDSYVADHTEALGHSYQTATADATCTTDGSVTYYCACGDRYTEVIPSTGHNYQLVVTAPTCTAEGYTTHICGACGDNYVTDKVSALGHNYETVTVDPTCTVGGYTASTCTVCGEGEIYNETAALGHDYDSVTVDPTETEGGYTTHTCNVCGHSYTDNYVDALGHSIVSVVTDPTCTTDGYTTHTCTTCGEVTVDTYVPALGHSYQTVTVDATCTEDGSVSGSCTTCGDSYSNVIHAYGHNYAASVTAPTCTEGGYTVYSCGRCGDTYKDNYTEALGHSYNAITTDVTCTQDGYTTYLCTGCGDSYIGETIPATGHSYETVTADATCTEAGSVTHICSSCGDTYSEEIPATGHDYQAVITAPTCTTGGYTTYTCDACGQSYTADQTAATGHSYSMEEVYGNQVYTCDHCGDTYTVATGWIAQSGRYVLDTDGIETGAGNKYIIVGSNKNYALTRSGSSIGAAQVTISSNAITLQNASNYEFYFADNSKKESGSYLLTQDGSMGIYHSGGNMYYGTDNKGYWHIGSGSNGAYQLYDYDNSTWYLNYGYVWGRDSVSRFAVSSTARSVRLFKATDSYVRLYGELNQVWSHGADATESAVLNKVQIQTSTDGVTPSGSTAVTSSMVTWDKTFDGYTDGTYTATVSYNGESIGTVTVVVTGEHTYETTVVPATCTTAGYSTHTCTVCGTSYTDGKTSALGHSYSSVNGDGFITYTCTRCGDSYTESTVSYQRVTSISSGNKYVITLYSGNKYYAVSHANNKISAVQVTVSNGQITSEISSDMLWNYSGNKLSYTSGSRTYYLYTSGSNSWWGNWWGSSSITLGVSTSSSSNVSLSNNRLKVGSYYLRYSNSSITASSSSTTAYAFLETK